MIECCVVARHLHLLYLEEPVQGDEEKMKRFRTIVAEVNHEFGKRFYALNEDYQVKLSTRERMARSLARVSPAASYAYTAMGLAGTGYEYRTNLYRQLSSYQKEVKKFFKEKTQSKKLAMFFSRGYGYGFGVGKDAPETIDPAQFPVLRITPMGGGETVSQIWLEVLVLFLGILITFSGASSINFSNLTSLNPPG